MSDFVLHKGRRAAGLVARSYGADPREVYYGHDNGTMVILSDGREGVGSCLGCGNAPCMEKSDSELTLYGALDAFPGDPSRDVCPTKAIHWSSQRSVAVVEPDDCIGCGLCISRCPYGAISLEGGLFAKVEHANPDELIVEGPTKTEHPAVERRGRIAAMDASAATNLPGRIRALSDSQTMLLVRNLLNEVGLNVRTRRRGDTNMRIDAVGFSRNERPFVMEIETGAGAIESPRALLEDVAVLHSRYGYAVSEIDPVSLLLSFPNIRSEYYQVIRDIETVLGLRCRTITVGALIALLWYCAKLYGFNGDHFTVGEDAIDITDCLGIDPRILMEPYPGAFKPAK